MEEINIVRLNVKKLLEKSESKGVLATEALIRELVAKSSTLFDIPEQDQENLVIRFLQDFRTKIGDAATIIDKDFHPWLSARKGEIDWRYWTRYDQYLRSEGWSDRVVDKMDDITDEILKYLNDPTAKGTWDRRGMVVGHVQSGKTANYIGLISMFFNLFV